MSFPEYDDKGEHCSKSPATTLAARVVTVISLIVPIVVLKINDVTLSNGYVLYYKDVRSYKYMFFVTVIAIAYTLLQLPFAIYYVKTKRHLINSYSFLQFDFYADKIMTFVLATAAGAALGVTLDMKKVWGNVTKADMADDVSKIEDYYTMAYIPSAFLLVGSIASWISSVCSSLALTKNWQ